MPEVIVCSEGGIFSVAETSGANFGVMSCDFLVNENGSVGIGNSIESPESSCSLEAKENPGGGVKINGLTGTVGFFSKLVVSSSITSSMSSSKAAENLEPPDRALGRAI